MIASKPTRHGGRFSKNVSISDYTVGAIGVSGGTSVQDGQVAKAGAERRSETHHPLA
jgi:uncharacterized protein GlcG (DUF336 family)